MASDIDKQCLEGRVGVGFDIKLSFFCFCFIAFVLCFLEHLISAVCVCKSLECFSISILGARVEENCLDLSISGIKKCSLQAKQYDKHRSHNT